MIAEFFSGPPFVFSLSVPRFREVSMAVGFQILDREGINRRVARVAPILSQSPET
jgi:hypothetical protein